MRIKTHHSLSLDGFSATKDGWSAISQVTEFKPKETHGIPEFTATTVAVPMGRTTFAPAIGNPWWPWPGRRVCVLSSRGSVLFGEGLPLLPLANSRQPLGLSRRAEHLDGSLELFYERP